MVPGRLRWRPTDRCLIAHYAPESKIVDALVFGTPVEALRGYLWVPTRDGEKYPLCTKCEHIFESLNHD